MALAPYALPRPLRKSLSLPSHVTLNQGGSRGTSGEEGGTAMNTGNVGGGVSSSSGSGGGGSGAGASSSEVGGGGGGGACVDDPFDVFVTAEERSSSNVHATGLGSGQGQELGSVQNSSNNNNNSLAFPSLSTSSSSSSLLFALATPENDEEAAAVEAACTLVQVGDPPQANLLHIYTLPLMTHYCMG